MVGAPSPSEPGLFYQWGDIVGHSFDEGFDFDSANYEAKGLNLISGDLDSAHDAARVYYGPKAKMPSEAQYQELIENCAFSWHDGLISVISNINGAAISIPPCGRIQGQVREDDHMLHVWSLDFSSGVYARSFEASETESYIWNRRRVYGECIMAVHS